MKKISKILKLKYPSTNPRGWQFEPVQVQPTPGVGKRVGGYLRSLFLLLAIFLPSLVWADVRVIPDPGTVPGPTVDFSPASIVALIFRITIQISAAIFLLMLLFGGVTYLTSAGNEEGTGKAKKMMLNAGIGLVIILASYGVGVFILKALGYTI